MAKTTTRQNKSQFWRRYRQNLAAWVATLLFGLVLLVSIFANVIANDRPIAMSYDGRVFFPVTKVLSSTTWRWIRTSRPMDGLSGLLFAKDRTSPTSISRSSQLLPAPPPPSSSPGQQVNR
jgi:ABC-type microcin C transport system permease subunit YejE